MGLHSSPSSISRCSCGVVPNLRMTQRNKVQSTLPKRRLQQVSPSATPHQNGVTLPRPPPRSTIEGPSGHKTQVPCCACRLKKWRHASIRLPVTPPCLLIVMHTDRVGHNGRLVFPRLAERPRPCILHKRRRGDGRHSNRLYIPHPVPRIPHPASRILLAWKAFRER